MKSKQRNALLACLALLSAVAASAQIRDGSYDGTMECGPPIATPSQAGWSQPVKLQITGHSVLWERANQRMSEAGTGSLHVGRVSLTLSGSWNPGEKSTGQWRTVTMLSLDGKILAGPATIYSADGQQRLRDCTVQIAVNAAPAVPPAVSNVSRSQAATTAVTPTPSRPSSESVQAAMQAALQIAGIAKPSLSLPPVPPSPTLTRPAPQPPSPAVAAQERATREREEDREAERARVATQKEDAARYEARNLEMQRRGQAEWEQDRREADRQREEARKVREEQDRQKQLAWKEQQERQARERTAEQAKREAHAKAAATRNATKIKALGLPSAFVSATLYANYMGQWTQIMPSDQWLGLLLENKKIVALEAISVHGHPGVSIKRAGQPAAGIVFRMEGKEAYVYGLVGNGRVEEIQSPAEHSQAALLLKALTDERNME